MRKLNRSLQLLRENLNIVFIHLSRSGLQPSLRDSARRFLELAPTDAERLWKELTGLRDDDWNRLLRTSLGLLDITIAPTVLLDLSRDSALMRVEGPVAAAVTAAGKVPKGQRPRRWTFEVDREDGSFYDIVVEGNASKVTVTVDDKRYLHIGEGILIPQGRYRCGTGGRPWCSYAGHYRWPRRRA